jgi:hypothetical protein
LRRGLSVAAAAASILLLVGTQAGCGGGSSNTPTSGLNEQAFVAIQVSSTPMVVVDASKDQLSSTTVSLGGSSPALMIPGPTMTVSSNPHPTTLVFNAGDNGISVVDDITDAVITTINSIDCRTTGSGCEITLPAPTESIAVSSDAKFIYAAISTSSQVVVADLTGTTQVVVKAIPATPGNCTATANCLPEARRIVLSHNNAKLLVFNEQLNQFEIINTADSSVQTITVTGLDHPVYGVFSADDSKAYILNCGAECGGTQASVSLFDMTSLTVTQSVNVDAASIGISDSTNLYVAGSNPATPGAGSLTVLPLSSLSGPKQIKIGDGFHQVISVFQGKVIVGARTCTTGCLSLVDPAGGTAIVDANKGDVTAISGITPRTVFYDAEGGELRIYDVSTGAEHLTNNTPVIDIVGKVTSVLYVGPKT